MRRRPQSTSAATWTCSTSCRPRAARWSADHVLDEAPWGEVPRVNLSLKLTSLYSQIDPLDFEGSRRALVAALRPLFIGARNRGVFVNLDLERFAYRDLTYAVFADLLLDDDLRDYPHVGVVVQAYLRDSRDDVQNLVDLARRRGTPFTVRLVKGAYWDYETIIAAQEHWPSPVFTAKGADRRSVRAADEAARSTTGSGPGRPSAPTTSAAWRPAVAMAEAAGLPPGALELQMLHGMAESIRRAAVAQGYRVREYVPVGELIPGMAYLVRRLLENTANESFLRLTFVQQQDPESSWRRRAASSRRAARGPEPPTSPQRRRCPPSGCASPPRGLLPVPERAPRRLLPPREPRRHGEGPGDHPRQPGAGVPPGHRR